MNSPPLKKIFAGQEPWAATQTTTMRQANKLWRSKIEELNDSIVKALKRFEAAAGDDFDGVNILVGQKAIVRNKVTVNFRKISYDDPADPDDQGLMLYFAIRPTKKRFGAVEHEPRHKGTYILMHKRQYIFL